MSASVVKAKPTTQKSQNFTADGYAAGIFIQSLRGNCSHTNTKLAVQYLQKIYGFDINRKKEILDHFKGTAFLEKAEKSGELELVEKLIWKDARSAGMDWEAKAINETPISIYKSAKRKNGGVDFDDFVYEKADKHDDIDFSEELEPSNHNYSHDSFEVEACQPWSEIDEESFENLVSWIQRVAGHTDRSGIRRAVRLALEAGVIAQAEAAGCAATLQASGVVRRAPRHVLLRTAARQRCARGGESEAEALDDLRRGIAGHADTALGVLAASGMPLARLQALREQVLSSKDAGERELAETVLAAGRAARSRRARDSRQGRLL